MELDNCVIGVDIAKGADITAITDYKNDELVFYKDGKEIKRTPINGGEINGPI